jgi:hypothetical protein
MWVLTPDGAWGMSMTSPASRILRDHSPQGGGQSKLREDKAMKTTRIWLTMLAISGLTISLTGCQSTVGGQTLPSAYFLEDDLQYFPHGPEFKLSNQVQRIELYKQQQAEFDQGIVPADAGF